VRIYAERYQALQVNRLTTDLAEHIADETGRRHDT
jgi:hypothetical protein